MSVAAIGDYTMTTYKRWPVEFVSGLGYELVASDGTHYVDLIAGLAVANVGHCHPRVVEAIASQASDLIHVSNLYGTVPQTRLSQRLARLTGGMKSFFCNSGAEAVEAALKLARRHGGQGKTGFVCADNAFHGRSFGALSATGQPPKKAPFEPLVPGFTHVPFGDVDALAGAVGETTAAVLLEPVQGESGVIVPPDGYLRTAREICDAAGALLIFDEVQSGLGRTGRWFAHEHAGVAPDIMCLAKGLGGGLPIGACLARPGVAASFVPGDHASTFGGGPVQCAAALATLEVIEEEDLLLNSAMVGAAMLDSLKAIEPVTKEIRGLGLFIGIELTEPVARNVAEGCFGNRVLVNDATPHVVRLCPPLVIDEGAALEACDVVVGSVEAVLS